MIKRIKIESLNSFKFKNLKNSDERVSIAEQLTYNNGDVRAVIVTVARKEYGDTIKKKTKEKRNSRKINPVHC